MSRATSRLAIPHPSRLCRMAARSESRRGCKPLQLSRDRAGGTRASAAQEPAPQLPPRPELVGCDIQPSDEVSRGGMSQPGAASSTQGMWMHRYRFLPPILARLASGSNAANASLALPNPTFSQAATAAARRVSDQLASPSTNSSGSGNNT